MPLLPHTRRSLLIAMMSAGRAHSQRDPSARGVLILSASGIPAFEQAVAGLRGALGGAPTQVVLLDQLGKGEQLSTIAAKVQPGAVVALGSEAVAELRHCPPGASLVAAMILGSTPATRADATLTLDLPPDKVLQRLRQIYPRRGRITVVRGPALSAPAVSEILAAGQRLNLAIEVLPCAGAKQLLDAMRSLRPAPDFLWCLPDAALYQGPALSALVLCSLRYRIPLIGFSQGMVRAGALVGFYPDYQDIGAQTAELVLRRLTAQPCPSRLRPRKVNAAVNERVARSFGIQPVTQSPGELEIVS